MLFKSTSIFPHGFVYSYELTNIKYYQQQSVMKTESCQSFPGQPSLPPTNQHSLQPEIPMTQWFTKVYAPYQTIRIISDNSSNQ